MFFGMGRNEINGVFLIYFNKYMPPFFSFLCIFVTVKP